MRQGVGLEPDLGAYGGNTQDASITPRRAARTRRPAHLAERGNFVGWTVRTPLGEFCSDDRITWRTTGRLDRGAASIAKRTAPVPGTLPREHVSGAVRRCGLARRISTQPRW